MSEVKNINDEKKKGIAPNASSTTVSVETVVLKDGTSFFVIRNLQGQLFKVCSTIDELTTFFVELTNLGKDAAED